MKLYQHHKNLKFYTSLGKAADQENGVEYVLYQNDEGRLFLRPYGMFFEEVMYQGKRVPRFQYMKDVEGAINVKGRTATHSETEELYSILSFDQDRFVVRKGEES